MINFESFVSFCIWWDSEERENIIIVFGGSLKAVQNDMCPVLSQINPVYHLKTYSFKILFILSFHLRIDISNCCHSFTLTPSQKNTIFSILHPTCYMHNPLQPRLFRRFYIRQSYVAYFKNNSIEWSLRHSWTTDVRICDVLWRDALRLKLFCSASVCIGRIG
jgi:hypothetical protein